jgi:hypothetical protein
MAAQHHITLTICRQNILTDLHLPIGITDCLSVLRVGCGDALSIPGCVEHQQSLLKKGIGALTGLDRRGDPPAADNSEQKNKQIVACCCACRGLSLVLSVILYLGMLFVTHSEVKKKVRQSPAKCCHCCRCWGPCSC